MRLVGFVCWILDPIKPKEAYKNRIGSSPKYGGHEHHLSISANSAAERLPRCLGGSQAEIGTRN